MKGTSKRVPVTEYVRIAESPRMKKALRNGVLITGICSDRQGFRHGSVGAMLRTHAPHVARRCIRFRVRSHHE